MALLGLGFKDSILAAACSLVKGFRAFVSRETRFGGPQTVRADGREGTHGYGPAILMGIVGQQPTVRSRQIQAPTQLSRRIFRHEDALSRRPQIDGSEPCLGRWSAGIRPSCCNTLRRQRITG
jgi:hypothetical protein